MKIVRAITVLWLIVGVLMGCRSDTDKDGVADYRDDCLGTSSGTSVDKKGCPIVKMPAGQVFRDRLKEGTDGPEMVAISAGRFLMGSIQHDSDSDEQPLHWVWVDQFAMGRYEVTVAEFRQFVNATGYQTDAEKSGDCVRLKGDSINHWRNPGFPQTDSHPVVCVSWNDAIAYTNWLTEQTGQTYRLPTEAEWEYAARAGSTTRYWWGNHIGTNRTNCDNSYCGDRFEYTAPVGSFAPNPFGLYDMAGNVLEWTCSEYQDKYRGNEQRCSQGGNLLVFRGGTLFDTWMDTRIAFRRRNEPNFSGYAVGFRLAKTY
jgi:formylglycine-generating enzyme required for sulfatase activity